MFYQFNLQLREQIKIKTIQDPFSENCMTYARQSCTLITEQMMQAHLIVTNSEADKSEETGTIQHGSTQAQKMRREIEKFKEHCMHLANWGQAELFYIFTTCNLIQTNDTTRFFRERVL